MNQEILSSIQSESSNDVFQTLEKEKLARQKVQKEKEFNSKIEDLATKYEESLKNNGPEHAITQLLYNFLGVAIEMKTMMESMKAINDAMECVTMAVQFLDATLDFDNVLMDDSLSHDYSPRGIRQMKRKMRQTIRNNKGRVEAIAEGLKLKYKMSQDMMTALTDVSASLAKQTKRSFFGSKKNKGVNPSAAVEAYLAKRNNGASPSSSSQSSAPSGPADISDIV